MKRLASVLLLLVSAALLAAAVALYRRQAPNADIAALMRASVAQIPAETLAAVRDGRLAEARRKLADLAVAQPTNPIVRYELGKLLQDSFREYADAIPEYVAFLRLAPDSAMAADAQSRLDGIRRELQQRYGRAETVVPDTSVYCGYRPVDQSSFALVNVMSPQSVWLARLSPVIAASG